MVNGEDNTAGILIRTDIASSIATVFMITLKILYRRFI
jgi:hypothetical protein